jgi:hypothetical protein
MKHILANWKITRYADGTLRRPHMSDDPEGEQNWDRNDSWAQQVIIQNVTSSQMNHIGSKNMAAEMYSALVDMLENKAHQMVTHIQTLLYETVWDEGRQQQQPIEALGHFEVILGTSKLIPEQRIPHLQHLLQIYYICVPTTFMADICWAL